MTAVRRLAPLLVALTVLAVLLGAVRLIHRPMPAPGPGAHGAPPLLRLAGYEPDVSANPPDAGYRLAGPLPDGPAEAAVWRLRAPTQESADALARALGLGGGGRQENGMTTYVDSGATLVVASGAGGSWHFEDAQRGGWAACPVEPPTVVGSIGPGVDVRCVSPETPSSSPDDALDVARPVLLALGLDPRSARVTAAGPAGQQIVVDAQVGGQATYGLTTFLVVAGRHVVQANGWLGGVEQGETYPVLRAHQAWDRWVRTPHPRPLLACPAPEPGRRLDPWWCGGPVTVVGARLGLSLQQDGDRPLLVPSWLFSVGGTGHGDGIEHLLPVVAVDPSFVRSGSPSGVQPVPVGGQGEAVR